MCCSACLSLHAPEGGAPGHPEGRDPGSRLCVPRDQAPQLGEHIRQRPLVSWRLLGTPEAPCIPLAAKVGEDYDTTCTFHTRTYTKSTEQPVFRASQDHCFDSQGEKIVIERTTDTCAAMSWGAGTGHTHTVSEQGRCHHNGLMSKELQGEYSGAGYTYCSVRTRKRAKETEKK